MNESAPSFPAVEALYRQIRVPAKVISRWTEFTYDETEAGGKVRNHRATIAACGKLDAIRRRWSDWILSDPVRRDALATIFRERFAGHAPRRYDGSGLTFPGLAASYEGKPLALHKHQRDAIARILLLHAVVMGFGGVPLLYMGDELGLLNDYGYRDVPEHADDNRWVHRPRMDWQLAEAAASDLHSPAGRILAGFKHLIGVRKATPHLHASAESRVMESPDPRLLVLRRDRASRD